MRLAEAEISPAEPIGLGEGVAECRLHLLWVGCSYLKRGFDSSGITGTGKKQPAAASSLKLTKPGGARPVPHGGVFARGTFRATLSSRFPRHRARRHREESSNCLSEFDNGSSRSCKIHGATPLLQRPNIPAAYAAELGLCRSTIASRPDALDRSSIDGFKFQTWPLSFPLPVYSRR